MGLGSQGGQSDRERCLEKQSTSGMVTDRAGPVRGGLWGQPELPWALAWSGSRVQTQIRVCVYPWPTLSSGDLRCHSPPRPLRMMSVTRKSGTVEDLGASCRTRQGLGGFAEPQLRDAAGPERARAQWISQRVARVRITHLPSGFGANLLKAPSPR